MFGGRRQFVAAALGLVCGLSGIAAQATQRPAAKKHVLKQEAPPPQIQAVPAPPPPPPTPEQLPASPPKVSYAGGMLTIIAQNSTLGDILRSVHTATGAVVELPGSAPERIVGQFGPGRAQQVLADLLNGSHYNYVVLGSATDPNVLEHVILSAKSGGEPAAAPQYEAAQQPQPGVPFGGQLRPHPTQNSAQMANDPNDDDSDQDDDENTQQQTEQNQEQRAAPGNQNAAPVKTPEQLLQELQQQLQRQQQQQEGGQSAPPQAGPQQR